jgi:signal transduction histidine kinase
MKTSLRLRIVLAAVLPVTLVAFLLTGLFVFRAIHSLEQNLLTRGHAIAHQLAGSAEFPLFAGDRASVAALADATLRSNADIGGVALTDASGAVLASGGTVHPANWPKRDAVVSLHVLTDKLLFVHPVLRTTAAVDDIYSGTASLVAASQRALSVPAPLGHVIVELSPRGIAAQRNELLLTGAMVALLGTLLGVALALLIYRSISEPLLEANDVVAQIARGIDSARMNTDAAGALHSLADGINAMAARVAMTQEDLRFQVAVTTAELLAQKDAAERATAAKSQFLSSASHDLRQPLHALGLFVSTLQQTDAARTEPVLVGNILSSVNALREMLDAILDVSHLDSGTIKPRMSTFALDDVITRLVRDLAPLATDKGLQLRVRPTGLRVRCDRQMVERILLNMLSNAARHTEHGGILVGCRRRAGKVMIEVWDTGKGIPQALLASIFDEYVQLDNPERDSRKGLGLGLAICRRLADILDVRIGVRSREARGTVFWIELPLAGDEALLSGGSADLVPTSRRATDRLADAVQVNGSVLVIDDDPATQAALQPILTGWGLQVGFITDKATVRQFFNGMHGHEMPLPDVVILNPEIFGDENGDIKGNELDHEPGHEPDYEQSQAIALAHVLQRAYPALGVLLISNDEALETQAAARLAGFPLLRKPVPPGRLRSALQHLLVNHDTS